MKTILKAVVMVVGLTAVLPSLANDEVSRLRAEFDQKIIAAANGGDPKGALALVGEALANDERQYGTEHAALLSRLYLQWQLLRETGADTGQIDAVSARIRAINDATLAKDDLQQLYFAGSFLARINQRGAAEPYFEKLVSIADERVDADRTWLYAGLFQLAECQSLTRSTYQKAAANLERLVALREKHQGKTHHDLVAPLRLLAQVREAEGEPYHLRVLALERQHHDETHRSVFSARLEVAKFYADHDMHRQALKALDGYMDTLEKTDPRGGSSPNLMPPSLLKARVLAHSGDYPGAARHLQHAYELVASQPDIAPESRLAALKGFLNSYGLTGSRARERFNDEQMARFAEATYQHQLARRTLPPELAFTLKLEVVQRALDRMPTGEFTYGVDVKALRQATVSATQDALNVRERHWPESDPARRELRELLARYQ